MRQSPALGVPMELLDVLDEGGEPSDWCGKRSMVHERGDYHRTSHVWVVREKPGSHEVLLQKRSSRKDSFAGCYDISSAGIFRRETDTSSQPDGSLRRSWGITASEEELEFAGFFESQYEGDFYGKPFLSTAKGLRSTFTEGRWRRNTWSSRPMRWILSGGWIWRRPARSKNSRRHRLLFTGRRRLSLPLKNLALGAYRRIRQDIRAGGRLGGRRSDGTICTHSVLCKKMCLL